MVLMNFQGASDVLNLTSGFRGKETMIVMGKEKKKKKQDVQTRFEIGIEPTYRAYQV
jgi:hypothetical protein